MDTNVISYKNAIMALIKQGYVDEVIEAIESLRNPPEQSKRKNSIETINSDRVNHPSHYTWLKDLCGIEVIDITRYMDFDLGNAIKYILRAGHKSEEGISNRKKEIEDLKKAVFYLNDKINMLEKEG